MAGDDIAGTVLTGPPSDGASGAPPAPVASGPGLAEPALAEPALIVLGAGEAPLVGGGSDASTSSAMGIASIDGLGPRGKGFHTVDEFIEVDTLIPKAQALVRYLASRAG